MNNKSEQVVLFQPRIILWSPADPQGDTAASKRDVKKILELAQGSKLQPMSLLVDVSRAEIPNLEQKKIIGNAAKKYTFDKIAVYGFSWRMKLAVAFISKLAGGLNIKLFNDQAEALIWLEQKN
jgi:hypothetical protein